MDAFDVMKNVDVLFNLFKEVVEWAFPNNMVHIVTDNRSNNVAASRMIYDHYKSIS